jgi:hypothetical protein
MDRDPEATPSPQIDNEFLNGKEQPHNTESLTNVFTALRDERPPLPKPKKPERKNEKGVEDNPEYFRVDFEVTHKLYEIYRRLKLVSSEQVQSSSFEEKEQGNSTMNYHKIMQIFKDIGFRLEVNQKLQVLRSIKKFCFNQNFISEEEFIKIFKVVVHGIGIKENAFKGLIAAKYTSVLEKDIKSSNRRGVSIKLNKNFGKKLKTEAGMESSKVKSQLAHVLLQEQRSFQTVISPDSSYPKRMLSVNPSVVIEERGQLTRDSAVRTARKQESRKRIRTDANRYESGEKGYLNRAIEKNKLGKLTWENLFKMTEENMHYNICIPSFVSQDLRLNELDL